MIGIKGQGTTEYLIILAIIIVIALVVAGVLGFFPGFASGISEQESKAYWQSTQPITIVNSKLLSDGSMALIIQNNSMNKIIIHSMTIDGITVQNRGEYHPSGLEKAINGYVIWNSTLSDPVVDLNCIFSAGEKNGLNINHDIDLIDCTPGEIKSSDITFNYGVSKGIWEKTLVGQKKLVIECSSGTIPAFPTQYIT